MCIREHLSSVTIAMLLTAGLVSWPMAAAAAGQSDPDTGEGIRTERAAALQMERTETKFSPLVLRLYGGFGRAEVGDINKGLDGYYEVLKIYQAMGMGTTTGGYNPLRDGYNAGADLVFQLSRKFGIGIGAGYMRLSESSSMTLSMESGRLELSGTPVLSAIPIRLGLFLTLPLGKRLNLTVNGGVAAYAALKLDSTERIVISDSSPEGTSLSASGGAPFENLGYQGSLGFEFMVSQNTGFFIEAEGRYARLKNFEKATAGSGPDTTEGRLYLVTHTFDEGSWSIFTVEGTPPVSDPPTRVYSEPKIDLSGFSLQAGLRIRL